MNKKYWDFRDLITIEEPVFNGSLERFYEYGLDGLVRENIQNSLDSKNVNEDKPVKVVIKTGIITSNQIPGIEEIRSHIECLEGGNNYTTSTIKHMKKHMFDQQVNYISFEDSNTKGLSGADRGQNGSEKDTWGFYAYKRGAHYFEKDEDTERSRGGSHGIGKIASNAASDLYLMFFANCDEYGNQHLGGNVQLIEHEYQGRCYRSTGYFTKVNENMEYYPFKNEFDSIFEKKERGLKIIIPYLRKQYQDEKQLVRSVCDNFFFAILNRTLIVVVNNLEINHESLIAIVHNTDYYFKQGYGEIKDNFTPLYVDTYLKEKPILIEISDKNRIYNFMFYLQYDREIQRGRIAIVRNIGMKIEDKKIRSYVNSPFNGILLPRSNKEDDFLKSMENEAHNALTFEAIKDQEEQKNAKRFINNISKCIGGYFDRIIKENNPSNGAIDTSDLIYSVESTFRKALSENVSTVKLTKGTKQSNKTVVKVKTQGRKKATRKKVNEPMNKIKRLSRRVVKRDGNEHNRSRIRYSMYPETIKRLVTGNKEILKLDFSKQREYDGEAFCDIFLSVIDGTGKEYNNEFSINKNYSKIVDKNTNKQCSVINNIIKDVSILDGEVNLEFTTTSQFNNSLKFVYYVEV